MHLMQRKTKEKGAQKIDKHLKDDLKCLLYRCCNLSSINTQKSGFRTE